MNIQVGAIYPISRNDTDSTNSDACWLGWALRCLSIPSLTPCTNNVSSCNPEWIDEHTGRSDHQIMGEAAHNLPAPPEDTTPLACSEVDNVNFSSATALPENDINSIITTLSKGPTGEQSPTNCLDELVLKFGQEVLAEQPLTSGSDDLGLIFEQDISGGQLLPGDVEEWLVSLKTS